MIDAAKFASAYTAFWNIATPTCEHFVRKVNTHLYDRINPPLKGGDTKDRAFISEFGFSLFGIRRSGTMLSARAAEVEMVAEEEARRRLAPFQRQGLTLPEALDADQLNEVRTICVRLEGFFNPVLHQVVMRPSFAGCGLIDRSEGDVLWGTGLFEVKTVDRPFRSNDIRQLLVYAALNHFSSSHGVVSVGIYNPRRGVSFERGIEDVSLEVSGRPASTLFDEISQAVSSGQISR